MIKRSTLWRLAVGAYAFINVAGLFYAWAMGEEMHAMLHLFLILIGVAGYVGWRIARRGSPQEDHLPRAQVAEQRIEYLQQSIDAMALELERVGEAQRFSDKLRVERGEVQPSKKDQ
jgi:membrane protein implicated in regulation of membrane protease activity